MTAMPYFLSCLAPLPGMHLALQCFPSPALEHSLLQSPFLPVWSAIISDLLVCVCRALSPLASLFQDELAVLVLLKPVFDPVPLLSGDLVHLQDLFSF